VIVKHNFSNINHLQHKSIARSLTFFWEAVIKILQELIMEMRYPNVT